MFSSGSRGAEQRGGRQSCMAVPPYSVHRAYLCLPLSWSLEGQLLGSLCCVSESRLPVSPRDCELLASLQPHLRKQPIVLDRGHGDTGAHSSIYEVGWGMVMRVAGLLSCPWREEKIRSFVKTVGQVWEDQAQIGAFSLSAGFIETPNPQGGLEEATVLGHRPRPCPFLSLSWARGTSSGAPSH